MGLDCNKNSCKKVNVMQERMMSSNTWTRVKQRDCKILGNTRHSIVLYLPWLDYDYKPFGILKHINIKL